jgi:hypothetical protein
MMGGQNEQMRQMSNVKMLWPQENGEYVEETAI